MTTRQEITVLCLCLIAAVLAMLGMVGLEAHEVDKYQARFVDERSVRVRLEDRCKSDAAGGAVCPAGTFKPWPTTSTTVEGR